MPYSAPIPWLLPWEPPSGMLKGSFFFLGRDDGTNRILSHDSNHIVNAAMWPKFGNASTFMREPIIASVLQVWPEKPLFWQPRFKFNKIGTVTRYSFEISHQCSKRVKTKSQKLLGANSYICRRSRGKNGREFLLPTPHPD